MGSYLVKSYTRMDRSYRVEEREGIANAHATIGRSRCRHHISTHPFDFFALPARRLGFTECQFGTLELTTSSQTVRIASSNTVLRPFCVRAEHSRYYMSAQAHHGKE